MSKFWKKSLIAAGVLSTMLTGSAFASSGAECAADQQRCLSYSCAIEQQVPHVENGCRPFGFHKDVNYRSDPRHGGYHEGRYRHDDHRGHRDEGLYHDGYQGHRGDGFRHDGYQEH